MNIVSIPNPVLFQKAEAVKTLTPKIKKFLAEMTDVLAKADNPKGIGLAAPQVGLSLRIFIIRLKENAPLHVFINPDIIESSKECEEKPDMLEGCLSIPTIWGPVKRHKTLRLRFMDLTGTVQEKTFSKMMATAIQHEMDHLDGTLFTTRVLEQQGKLFRMEKDEKGETVFKEVEL